MTVVAGLVSLQLLTGQEIARINAFGERLRCTFQSIPNKRSLAAAATALSLDHVWEKLSPI